jgi:hypothetical protein
MLNDSFPRRTTALLRAAAALAAMFLLTGAFVSCEGITDENGNNSSGGSDGTHPNSAAMAKWTPDTEFDTCTKDFHDTYYVIGPDSKKYPTWHPPTATDPTTGKLCSFGHEHGRDPRGSALWDSLRNHFAHDTDGNGTIDTAERDAMRPSSCAPTTQPTASRMPTATRITSATRSRGKTASSARGP